MMRSPSGESVRLKSSLILPKTGPVFGELTPILSLISPDLGFKNHTHSSHQNCKEGEKEALLFCFYKPSDCGKVRKV